MVFSMSSELQTEDYLIFCDFDGTIAEVDVGYKVLSAFSVTGNDDLEELWNTRKIGARECLKLEVQRIESTREQMLAYVDQFSLDKTFTKFVEFAEEQGRRIIVLSDGLDFYIERLLSTHGLERLEVHTNRAVFNGAKLTVEFPYDEGCGVCGSCKAARIRDIKTQEGFKGTIVFIGDGYSDICAIAETDALFATGDLQKYCVEENIKHTAFETFADIGRALFADWK
jgi:2-hydroxy-3-keto-5-methylthiopentenyl-1-phosphate phosphatase